MKLSVAVIALVACSSVDGESSCHVSSAQGALTNGALHADYLGLEAREEAAIVQVGFRFDESGFEEWCSGVVVATGVVVSAKHCLHDRVPLAIDVYIELASAGTGFLSEATIAGVHDELDLMVLLLHETPIDPSEVASLPLALAVPDGLGLGALVQVAGFGEDSAGFVGRRAFLVEELLAIGDHELVVGAGGLAGACFGDSGGPLVVRGDDGSARTLGILSSGAPSCYGEDRYTRVDVVADWIAATAGVDVTAPVFGPHSELGREGRCFGGTSVWVENDSLQGVVCDASEPCGWSAAAGGFRCLPATQDACRGLDDLGSCIDGAAVRCVRGVIDKNPCEACGFACARSPMSGRAICLGE